MSKLATDRVGWKRKPRARVNSRLKPRKRDKQLKRHTATTPFTTHVQWLGVSNRVGRQRASN
jgi:hypothetical protein